MNQDKPTKPKQTNGTEDKDGAGVRFVPSEEPNKLEPTPETAEVEKNARH